jgi:hypothetical protein
MNTGGAEPHAAVFMDPGLRRNDGRGRRGRGGALGRRLNP